MNELENQLYSWLLRRSSSSETRRIRATNLVNVAANQLHVDFIELREAFRNLRDQGLIDYAPDRLGLPFAGFATVAPRDADCSPSRVAWQHALSRIDLSNELRSALIPLHEMFADLNDEDMISIVAGLHRIQGATCEDNDSFGFSVSAKELLGSSKILERLPQNVKRILGVANLPSTPRYLVVAGPANPKAVLLIENTTTYEEAVRAGLDADITLIAAYGYGLNMMSDSIAGGSLVGSILGGQYEVLSRSGASHQISKLLTHPQLLFWGDLDREGLRIALSLREKLPQLRLSALYQPMTEMVRDTRTSHPYSMASGKNGQQEWKGTGLWMFDKLASLCDSRAVDQEAVRIELHREFAGRALTEKEIN
ncbi:Wadjet anti-phage system protein JetD domain-containing protein [Permianibacter aggregans]|uniref:Uncharacterized protein DUF2220 n=1 Tax=Permianibacter aggregans TaxID=1510150 RepID=A0A4R6UQ95_9GAMM|nr:Wadjet anti-phage system protein JetD domain-containing protein [Permianibacter aggregans]TDQ47415.1 uncharacterized protein DUF2220 [Permianibacter aggregans]